MKKKVLAIILGVTVTLSFAAVTIAEEKASAKEIQIKHAQEDLATLGYYSGEATGKINKETQEAVKKFQEKEMNMKTPNGILNKKTCDALRKKAEKKLKKEEVPAKYGPVEGTKKIE
jgi:peptidoglycan hydrolase-like protein with peptidoglycan-binding domain